LAKFEPKQEPEPAKAQKKLPQARSR